MTRYNTYVFHATDSEGEVIFTDERIVSGSIEAAWREAVKRALDIRKKQRREGFLVGTLEEMHCVGSNFGRGADST